MTGALRIQGSDITNPNGLANLTSVDGFLRIISNGALTGIDGLARLTSVGTDNIVICVALSTNQ